MAKRPSVAEIVAHPNYPEAIWNLTPTQSGQLAVAKGRGGPFKIDWEVHGNGPIKLVVCLNSPQSHFKTLILPVMNLSRDITDCFQWIMGLGAFKVRSTVKIGTRG